MELYSHQLKAIEQIKNGSILCGDVGTGKSRTALAYYYSKVCGGDMKINGEGSWGEPTTPRDLFIITTAKKRDDLEWINECVPFGIYEDSEKSVCNIKLKVDSWNNIKKYTGVTGSFFIFDEQRVCGYGAWSKAFLKIARNNQWILLSATPGDTWSDYIPVFIANGFYRNKADFNSKHCIFSPFTSYPKIERYVNVGELMKHRSDILVRMKYQKKAVPHHVAVHVVYDKQLYLKVFKNRWDPYGNCPIEEVGKLCYLLRKVINSDQSRIDAVKEIVESTPKVIIFYNYIYELECLRKLFQDIEIPYAEWNGQKHEKIPTGSRWGYFVQYSAGCEGWNCITSDTIIFYSQSYSYKMTTQASGRIDRMNTPFTDLYYYHIKSSAPIDMAIGRALSNKRDFNEKGFIGK